MTCSILQRLARSAYSLLIIAGTSLRTDSRYDDAEAFAQQLANWSNLLRRGYHSLESGTLSQRRQPEHLIQNPAGNAGLLQVFIVHAGQNRHSQQIEVVTGSLFGRPQHLCPSAGVDSEHACAQSSSVLNCLPYGIRNVMELRVEENPASGTHQFPDKIRPLRRKELQTDLKEASSIPDLADEFLGSSGIGNVESDNQPLPHRIGRSAGDHVSIITRTS